MKYLEYVRMWTWPYATLNQLSPYILFSIKRGMFEDVEEKG